MSEETKTVKLDILSIFEQSRQTYEQELEKQKSEQRFQKTERFRTAEDGDYSIRILPLCPVVDEDGNPQPLERKGYEYCFHQFFLKIALPKSKGKKPKFIQIPVVKPTDKGVDLPVDLLETYASIAESYDEEGDTSIADKVKGNGYSGGLKYSYNHAMYVLDLNNGRKGPLLYTISHAQYLDLQAAKMRVWDKLKAKGKDMGCPISDMHNAYPVEIKRSNENKKTSYRFDVDTMSDTDELSMEELGKLFDMRRIPEEVYKYTRYQLEATLVFLQQYDETLDIDVCAQPDFQEAVEKLKAALPKDDTSHFDLAKEGGSDKKSDGKKVEVTIDSLFDELDALTDAGLGKNSDEYKELREKIAQFVDDNGLDVRISHSKSNQELLTEIEDAMNDKVNTKADAPAAKEEAPAEEEKPVKKEESKSEEEEASAEEAPRKRRTRPVVEDEEEKPVEKPAEKDSDDEEEEQDEEEEAPVVHTRRRR